MVLGAGLAAKCYLNYDFILCIGGLGLLKNVDTAGVYATSYLAFSIYSCILLTAGLLCALSFLFDFNAFAFALSLDQNPLGLGAANGDLFFLSRK